MGNVDETRKKENTSCADPENVRKKTKKMRQLAKMNWKQQKKEGSQVGRI